MNTDTGCSLTDGWKVSFPNSPPSGNGVATILIKATENTTGKIGYTSFTVRLDNPSTSINPPSIQNLPNYVTQIDPNNGNRATYKTQFVIGDLDESGHEDICEDESEGGNCESTLTIDATSNNHAVLKDYPNGISIELLPPDIEFVALEVPRHYTLTATTEPGQTGVAIVTVNLKDKDDNVTSTSFVLQVFPNSDAPPSINNSADDNFAEQLLPATSKVHQFIVASNDSTAKQDLKVSAFSSNTKLVPNDFVNNLIVTPPDIDGNGSVEIFPNLAALPSPSPGPGGLPQTSTITLSVTDDAYTRQTTFLYVLRDPSSPALSFSRPSGVYATRQVLDPIRFPFLTGPMYNLQWDKVEDPPDEMGDHFDFDELDEYIDFTLPPGQDLSLDLHKEPCYIAQHTGVVTWCDTDSSNNPTHCSPTPCPGGFERAVPWDAYLQERRENFIEKLAEHLRTVDQGRRMAKISIINTNLPGAGTGIRNVTVNFNSMPDYSRVALLEAIQKDLRLVQDNFPAKLVQIGFFPAMDCNASCQPDPCDPSCPDNEFWRWLYKDATTDAGAIDENGVHLIALFDEFNGVKRPRVSFFQENLSATRTSIPNASPTPVSRSNAPNYITAPSTTAYTITPMASFVPSFAYYNGVLTNDQYNNGITFQANTIWSNPFSNEQGEKLTKTINGSPNDAMEGAFNTFLSQYLEVYVEDMDVATPPSGDSPLNAVLWEGQLQSWHDYSAYLRSLAPIEAPAGLTVERTGDGTNTSNLVKWSAVYGATRYLLQQIDFSAASPTWVDTLTCDPTLTYCTDTASTGTKYGYRVRAKDDDGNGTPWAYVAVFLSEGANDGYISCNASTCQAMPTATPGIRAGRGNGSSTELRGFLSFDTSSLAGTTVLGAKLRLHQTTNNDGYTLGPCKVDIKKGSFNDTVSLEPADFTAAYTHENALQVRPLDLTIQTPPDWVEAELSPLYVGGINNSTSNTGRTQFRIYFTGTTSNKLVKWNSGETVSTNPSTPPQLIVQYRE